MIVKSNWLEHYFAKNVNLSSGVDWQNETSSFENKLSGHFLRRHSEREKVITRMDLQQALQRSDCEEYLSLLVQDFVRRQLSFDPTIDISSVLRRFSNGCSYTDSFCEVLGLQKEPEKTPAGEVAPDLTFQQDLNKTPIVVVIPRI